jgi:parvulin-like peptidyl-prolyl isomerase
MAWYETGVVWVKEENRLMTMLSRAIPCLLAALLVTAAGEPPAPGMSAPPNNVPPNNAPAGADVVAQRGDVHLTGPELRDTLSLLDPAVRAQVNASPQNLAAFARERVLNMSVLAEAKAQGWDTKPDVVLRMNEARDAVVLQTYLASLVPPDPLFPSEAEITAAYEANKARMIVPRQFHIAQIVLLVKQDATPKDDEDIRQKAIDLRAQTMRPKADFGDIAKRDSQEKSSAPNGGDVGWLREPDMVPTVKEAVAGLSDGGISQPVRVPDGWHILKLLGTKPAGPLPLQDAKPQIVQALRQARAQRLMRAHLDEMMKTRPIELNEIELTKQVGAGK